MTKTEQKKTNKQSRYLAQIRRMGASIHSVTMLPNGDMRVIWSSGGCKMDDTVTPRDA